MLHTPTRVMTKQMTAVIRCFNAQETGLKTRSFALCLGPRRGWCCQLGWWKEEWLLEEVTNGVTRERTSPNATGDPPVKAQSLGGVRKFGEGVPIEMSSSSLYEGQHK
ncbi:hypothetical protein TNCV_676691 [Trichonephila clavipes]|nr:hypothetical protein TNCV_676691 [Trichonephila clavipes]